MESQRNQSFENNKDGPSRRNRIPLSCVECHRRKQKCNRELPCNDCTQRGVSFKCRYQEPRRANHQGPGAKNARLKRIITGSEVVLSVESVAALKNQLSEHVPSRLFPAFLHTNPVRRVSSSDLAFGFDPWFLGSIDPFSSLPHEDGEPIPKRALISHFLYRLAPWMSNYDESLTPSSPRVSFLPFALNHLPLFYATLLCGAVHLDRCQPVGNQNKLLWYKVKTMRLANELMNIPSEGCSDQMILVALVLLYFNVGAPNPEEYEIHLKGINQMLTLRGGLKALGMRGMVKNWLDICYGPWQADFEYGTFSSE